MYGEKIYVVVYIENHQTQVALFETEQAANETALNLTRGGLKVIVNKFEYLNEDAL